MNRKRQFERVGATALTFAEYDLTSEATAFVLVSFVPAQHPRAFSEYSVFLLLATLLGDRTDQAEVKA